MHKPSTPRSAALPHNNRGAAATATSSSSARRHHSASGESPARSPQLRPAAAPTVSSSSNHNNSRPSPQATPRQLNLNAPPVELVAHSSSISHNNNTGNNGIRSPTSAAASSNFSGGHSVSSSSIGGMTVHEAVALAEVHHSLRTQLEEQEAQIRTRQTRLDELVVVQAALNSQSNALRRKQIALDPLRHTVQRMTQEVKKLERDLQKINDVLAEPEVRLNHLRETQAKAEESYVDRFSLRPHRMSDKTVITLGGLAKSDLHEFEASRRRDEALRRQEELRRRDAAEKEKRRRFEEDDKDPAGIEDLLVRCGEYNSAGLAGFQDALYGKDQLHQKRMQSSSSSPQNNVTAKQQQKKDQEEQAEAERRRLPPTSVVPAWFQTAPVPHAFDVKVWEKKHPKAPPIPGAAGNAAVEEGGCPSDASVVTQYTVDGERPKRKMRFVSDRIRSEVWDKF